MQKLCSTTKNIDSSLLRSRFCQTFLCIWKMRCSSTDQHSCSFSDHKYFPKQAPIKLSTYYGTTRKEKWFKDQKGVTAWFWYSFKLYSYPSAAWSWRQPGNFKSSSPFILSTYVSLSQAVQYTLFFFFEHILLLYYLHCKYIWEWEDSSSWHWGGTLHCRLQSDPSSQSLQRIGILPLALPSTLLIFN